MMMVPVMIATIVLTHLIQHRLILTVTVSEMHATRVVQLLLMQSIRLTEGLSISLHPNLYGNPIVVELRSE